MRTEENGRTRVSFNYEMLLRFELAQELGMTVAELEARMSCREMSLWRVYPSIRDAARDDGK